MFPNRKVNPKEINMESNAILNMFFSPNRNNNNGVKTKLEMKNPILFKTNINININKVRKIKVYKDFLFNFRFRSSLFFIYNVNSLIIEITSNNIINVSTNVGMPEAPIVSTSLKSSITTDVFKK